MGGQTLGDTKMVRRRMLPLALIGLVAVLALLAFFGTTGGATYEGSEKCGVCHDDMLEQWEDTMHGIDFATEWMRSGNITNKYTYSGGNDTTGEIGSCASCHVVAYGEESGFDPDLAWNDSYNAGSTEGENLHLLRIGCENCHGAGSDHTSSKDAADIIKGEFAFASSCGGNENRECHGGYRQWGNETIPGFAASAHWLNEAPDSAKSRVSCAECRASEGYIARIEGNPWEELPEEGAVWKVTCMACHDPHPEGEENDFQLRLPVDEVCESCHHSTSSFGGEAVHHPQTEMRTGTPGYSYPSTTWMGDVLCVDCHMFSERRVSQGHLMEPNPKACMECHSMYETPEDAEAAIEHVMDRTTTALEPAIESLGAAQEDGTRTGIKGLKDWAVGNESAEGDLWTAALELAYSEAHWDLTMIEADKSGGFHNPVWAMGLIAGSVDRIEMIEMEMNIGGVDGTVNWIKKDVVGDAIEGAVIKNAAGETMATTDVDGKYFFWAPAQNLAYTIHDDAGMLIGTSMIEATPQANMTKDITVEKQSGGDDDTDPDETEGMTTISWVLLGVVIVLVLLLVVMAMKGGKEE